MSNPKMAQELQKVNPEVSVAEVKKYICPKATDSEIFLFVQLCRSQRLDPWRKEAYLIKYGDSPATIVVGKDLFTKRAQQSPKFAGFKSGIIIQRKKNPNDTDSKEYEELWLEGSFKRDSDILRGGWAEVMLKDYEVPIKASVSMTEYNRNQSSWKSIPCTMIRKVALVQALREAFPDELGGLLDESEVQSSGQIFEGEVQEEEDRPVIPRVKEVVKEEGMANE